MMTLDEAIEHAEWCAKEACGECAEEHRQLAEWLRELRRFYEVGTMEREAMRTVALVETERKRVEDHNNMLKVACVRLVNTVRVGESMTDCELIDARFARELRDLGIEVES